MLPAGAVFGQTLDPLPFVVQQAVHPQTRDVYFAAGTVNQNTGVADAIVFGRQAAPPAHVEHGAHGFPGLAAVGGTAQADGHTSLEIARGFVPGVVDGEQGAFGGGGQAGDATGVDAVLSGLADDGIRPLRTCREMAQEAEKKQRKKMLHG